MTPTPSLRSGAPFAHALLLTALTAWLAPAAAAAAQDPEATALRLQDGTRIELDGRLTEAFWANAQSFSDFRTLEPLEGAEPTERTEVRIAWDQDALYIGVHAFDSEPDQVVARVRQRDQLMNGSFRGVSFTGDDGVAIILDPFDDDRNGIIFATNANGAYFDALLSDEGGSINVDWQGVWEVAGARTEDGWSAEFRIPWRSIRYPAGADTSWGLNVLREIPRKQEEILWRSWQREGGGFDRVSRAGTLSGLVDLPAAGAKVELKPYFLGGVRGLRPEGGGLEYGREFDFGADLKAEVRPGLVLDLTANTDFAQVEVDDQQVNLTRFSLFFPERRDFFLENSGVFEFGRRGFFGPPPFLMFFSRRVGIGPDGPVPILGGGRLSGRVGDQTVGLLSIATDDVPGQEQEIFNVARVKRDIGESGYLGLMMTDRRGDGPSNSVIGVDGRLLLHPTLDAEAFAARSTTEEEGGEGMVAGGSLSWTTDLWGGFAQGIHVGEDFRTRTGFVARTDYQSTQINLRRSFRPDFLDLRKVDFRINTERGWTTTGRFQERKTGPSVRAEFNSGGDINVQFEDGAEQVDDAFVLADSLAVPAGRYSNREWSIRASTTSARALRLGTNYRRADFYGGTVTAWGADLTWAASSALVFAPRFSRSHVELPSGEFTADLWSMRATWAASPLITTNASLQYNALQDQVITNIRFNFIHRPGSDLFVVFSDERLRPLDRWRTEDRGLLVKLTYLIRF